MSIKNNMFYSREKLDGFVLNIEFLLISVVQGVALTFLATFAIDPLMKLDFAVWPYIFSSFLFILLFWSQSIIHALSFIDWPLNLPHGFFYFLASFLEVLAFSQVTNPLHWYIVGALFFITAGLLYTVDLSMIRARKKKFSSPSEQQLFNHIYMQQKNELIFMVPAGILFSLIAISLIHFMPELMILKKYHIVLGTLQFGFTLFLLCISVYNFKKRTLLISKCVR